MLTMAFVARILLALVFIAAAVTKLRDSASVAATVGQLTMLSHRWATNVARWLPWVELAGGLLLAAGLFVGPVAALTAALLLAFTAVLLRGLLTGRTIPCGCFGTADTRPAGWSHIGRNSVLLLAAAVLIPAPATPLSVDAWRTSANPALTGEDAVALFVATTSLLLMLTLAGQVWADRARADKEDPVRGNR